MLPRPGSGLGRGRGWSVAAGPGPRPKRIPDGTTRDRPARGQWPASMYPPAAAARSHDAAASFMIPSEPRPGSVLTTAPPPGSPRPPHVATAAAAARDPGRCNSRSLGVRSPILHTRQAFQRLCQLLGPTSCPLDSNAGHATPSALLWPASTLRAQAWPSTNAACSTLAPSNNAMTPLFTSCVVNVLPTRQHPGPALPGCSRATAPTAAPRAGPTRPKRKSSFTSTLNFSKSARRRHTQLLC